MGAHRLGLGVGPEEAEDERDDGGGDEHHQHRVVERGDEQLDEPRHGRLRHLVVAVLLAARYHLSKFKKWCASKAAPPHTRTRAREKPKSAAETKFDA